MNNVDDTIAYIENPRESTSKLIWTNMSVQQDG